MIRALPLLLSACALEPVVLLDEDPSAMGLAGERGPLGAELLQRVTQARVTERLHYSVVSPVGGVEPYPLVTFIQGGLVEPSRYHWAAAHMASRGFVVVLPEHDANLAITQSGNSDLAVDALLRSDLARRVDESVGWAAMGHSLGGVLAAGLWTRDERYAGLAFLASFASEATPIAERQTGRALSLLGSDDFTDLQSAMNSVDRFVVPADFGMVSGMGHYAWTDDPAEFEQQRDGQTGRAPEATRPDAMRVLDTFLDAVLLEDSAALESLESGQFPGVEWNP